ncbi:hypothetical protein ANN_21428 [Periplaneta americana]|uniref:Uncharacterized protein n=1 Tax=Periplaneta americana TaxID=6978 RepID=A0ABQ8SF90_PERAM|nr:hypothetical protein ANN_21428 [Periplaneta americana]
MVKDGFSVTVVISDFVKHAKAFQNTERTLIVWTVGESPSNPELKNRVMRKVCQKEAQTSTSLQIILKIVIHTRQSCQHQLAMSHIMEKEDSVIEKKVFAVSSGHEFEIQLARRFKEQAVSSISRITRAATIQQAITDFRVEVVDGEFKLTVRARSRLKCDPKQLIDRTFLTIVPYRHTLTEQLSGILKISLFFTRWIAIIQNSVKNPFVESSVNINDSTIQSNFELNSSTFQNYVIDYYCDSDDQSPNSGPTSTRAPRSTGDGARRGEERGGCDTLFRGREGKVKQLVTEEKDPEKSGYPLSSRHLSTDRELSRNYGLVINTTRK